MKTVILDDEMGSIQTLEDMLQLHCRDVQVVGVFQYPDEALEALPVLKPDLLFLDVEMPVMNGFAFLDQLNFTDVQPEIILTTAYAHYKSQASQYATIEFLVKPLDEHALIEAVSRARAFVKRNSEKQLSNRSSLSLANGKKTHPSEKRVFLPIRSGVLCVRPSEIVRIAANGMYADIFLTEKRKVMVAKHLGHYEKMLIPAGLPFFKVHESHLVHFEHIRAYLRTDGGLLEMSDGEKVPIARRRKEDFENWFDGFSI